MQKKTLLITGGNGMLAYDFIKTQSEDYTIIALDRTACDITSYSHIEQLLKQYTPDIVLNCAAYTAVDDAEDIGMKLCYDINTLGSYNLARATSSSGIDFVMLSTDYVFDGTKEHGYLPEDACNPLGVYGMSKYLSEQLVKRENPKSVIIRTSWLYGGERYGEDSGVYKNFVNTMLRLSETRNELRVVSDQYGIPTSCVDLSHALSQVIQSIQSFRGDIIHFSNSSFSGGIHWADFAREIYTLSGKTPSIQECSTQEYPLKAVRPQWSILLNPSTIQLPDWKDALKRYLTSSHQ